MGEKAVFEIALVGATKTDFWITNLLSLSTSFLLMKLKKPTSLLFLPL